MRGFEYGKIVIECAQNVGRVRFGNDDPGGPRRDHRLQIRLVIAACHRIDAHPERRAALPAPHIFLHQSPRMGAPVGRDSVFQIQDQRIGRRGFGLFELALAVGGNKEERAQDHDR